jgi:hypothetical protein
VEEKFFNGRGRPGEFSFKFNALMTLQLFICFFMYKYMYQLLKLLRYKLI